MIKFNCRACGYSTEKNEKPLKCPYCGKTDKIMLDKISDLNRLIQESE